MYETMHFSCLESGFPINMSVEAPSPTGKGFCCNKNAMFPTIVGGASSVVPKLLPGPAVINTHTTRMLLLLGPGFCSTSGTEGNIMSRIVVAAGKASYSTAIYFVGRDRQWGTSKDIDDNLSQMKDMIDRRIQNGDDAAMINDLLSKWNSIVRQYRFTPDQERKLKEMEVQVHEKMIMWGIAFRDVSTGQIVCTGGQCPRVMKQLDNAKKKQEPVQGYGMWSVNRDRNTDVSTMGFRNSGFMGLYQQFRFDPTSQAAGAAVPALPAPNPSLGNSWDSCAMEVQGRGAIDALSTPGAYIVVTDPSRCQPCMDYAPKFENAARRSKNPHYIIREDHPANASVMQQLTEITHLPAVLHVNQRGVRSVIGRSEWPGH